METALNTLFNEADKWMNEMVKLMPNLIISVFIMIIFVALGWVLKRAIRAFYNRKLGSTGVGLEISSILGNLSYLISIGVGLIFVSTVLGLDHLFASLLASLGVLGIVLGYAFKDVASNFFAGTVIAFRRPYKIGDLVNIVGYFGSIVDLGMLYTCIKTRDGQMVYVPNQSVFTNTVENYNTFKERRIVLKTGVSYGDDLSHVKSVAINTIKGLSAVKENYPIEIYFTEIGGSSYNFELRYWIHFKNQQQYLSALSDGICKLKSAFAENDISIPYPVQSLDFGVKGGVNLSEVSNIKGL